MNADAPKAPLALAAVALASLAALALIELGLCSMHSSTTAVNTQVNTTQTSMTDPEAATAACNTSFATETTTEWSWPVWMVVYQRHTGASVTQVTWTSVGPCQRKGESTITVDIVVSCTGLRASRDCRSELNKVIEQQVEKVRTAVTAG